MKETIALTITLLIAVYVVATLMYVLIYGLSCLNPVRNYKKWTSLNYLGVGVITLLINVILLPYAVCYWIYKLIYMLFTIGRKPS